MAAELRLLLGLAALVAALSVPGRAQPQAAAPEAVDACPAERGCKVADGYYRIVLPPQAAPGRRLGAIMYFHGYQGSAEETVADRGLVAVAQRLGVALVAPHGAGRTWSFPGSPAHNRDEFAYVGQVLDDAVQRFALDPGRIMASGFSQGGSMVWYLACRMPSRFAAFAPIAGAFWEPLPERCAGPRPRLIHVHGMSDTTVPLAGRRLRHGNKQGSLFSSLAVLAPGGCAARWAEAVRTGAPPQRLACRVAAGCDDGARLELCLHAGGHMADPAWIERAWGLMMAAAVPSAPAGAKLTFP